jgi:MFS family permease
MPGLDRKWWTLIAVCTAIFMLLLDITVVNVALPDIQRSLHSSFSDLQWVVDAYSLTLAAFLLTAGVVGDARSSPPGWCCSRWPPSSAAFPPRPSC